jgi:predicted DNA-binding transcriptional regulator AlpA
MSTTSLNTDQLRHLDGPLLRPEQAADLLGVKTSWIYDAVRTRRAIRILAS